MSFLKGNNTQRDIAIFVKSNKLSNLYFNLNLSQYKNFKALKSLEEVNFIKTINSCIDDSVRNY